MVVTLGLLAATTAAASPTHVLRLATIAPDGTEWARLSRSFTREVYSATDGQVQIKWYFGGIAGGEGEVIDRIRRGQLDGAASGGMTCQRLAPSMKVMRIVGLFQNRDEALYVLSRLRPRLDRELADSGFANLGEAGFGSDIIFSREPVGSLAQLRRGRYWVWDLDDLLQRELPAMGIRVVPLAVENTAASYEAQRSDGFLAIPTAALAYQWSAQARYYTDLRLGYLMGCLVIANASFDPLPTAYQQSIRGAAAKLMRQVEEMGGRQDAALLGELFQKQGLRRVPVSAQFRAEFFGAARAMRATLGDSLTSPQLLSDVSSWLADHRSEHQP